MGIDYCPNCNTLVDMAVDPIGTMIPNPGDISVCIYCESVNIFSDDMALRLATSEELSNLDEDTKILIRNIKKILDEIR